MTETEWAALLELSISKRLALGNDLRDLTTLLRGHTDRHSPYALACRDIAHLLYDITERHR